MKRLRQTLFGGADAPVHERGNCWATCVACVLDVEVEAVPNFCGLYDHGWYDAAFRWLEARGVGLLTWRSDPLIGSPYGERITLIASGPGPRGHRHSVLWQNGKLLHDPHPSDAGITAEIDEYDLLILTDAAAFRRWHAALLAGPSSPCDID